MGFVNTVLILIMMVLNFGCNNPKGSSVISPGHSPFLKEPGTFTFSSIRFNSSTVDLAWTPSSRTSGYKIFYGTSNTAMTTEATTCAGMTRSCAISGLDPSLTYFFKVESTNVTGTKVIDPIGSATSVGAFDINSSSAANGSLTLNWSSAPGASSYNVVYGLASGSYTGISSNVTSPHTITGLNNNTAYFVRVVATNNNNGYALSTSEISETPIGAPLAPASVTILASTGLMSVDWSTVPGATSYKVYRGTSSGALSLIASGLTGSTYNDNTIVDGTTYFYAVKASNGLDSPLSNEASAKSISIFAATAANPGPIANQITVTWPMVTGADSYDIKYGTNPSLLNLTASNVTSPYILTGLTGSSLYYIKLVAKNSVGLGNQLESSNQLSAMPVSGITPPTSVLASASPGQVTLNWSSVTGASSYTLLRGTSSGAYTTLQSGIVGTTYSDTSVVNGTTYFYVVKSFNGLYSGNSSEVSIKPIGAATISALTPVSSSSMNVTWPTVAGADSYDILYGTSSGVYSSSALGVTSPYVLTGLQASRIYYIVVRAKNTVGTGTTVLSSQSFAQTKTVAPTSLTATASPTQISVNWATVTGAVTYTLYRGTTSGNYSQLASNLTSTSYTDSGATPGNTYYYAVSATNDTESTYSSELSVKSIASFEIASHSAPSPTTIQVAWPSANGADTYDVKYGTVSGTYTTTLTNKTSPYTITGLTSGATYYFVVVGKNALGSASSYTTTEKIEVTPKGAPTGVTASAVNDQINLSWSAVTGVSSYKLYRGTSSGVYTLLQSNLTGTSYSDTTALSGTTYYYVLRSFNGTESADSSEVSAQTIADFAIASVTPLSATSLQVTFPNTSGGNLYDVRYGTSTGSYTTTVSAVTSPYTITGLSANTNYYIVVRARNTVGSGANRSTAEELMKTLITSPSSLTASAAPGQVGLNWSATPGATYKVYRGTASATYSEIATGLTTNAYLDTTVVDGTTYYYAIKANNGNDSAYSNEVIIQSIGSFLFSSGAAASSSTANLTWTAATGASSYDVRYGTSPGVYLYTVTGVTSPHTLTDLTANTTYYVSIRAKNAVGPGTNLDSLERNFKTATAANSSPAAAAVTGQINLTWSVTTGATSYNIYRGTSSGIYSQIASGISGTSYADTTISDGTTYYYMIRSFNGIESANSSEVSAQSIAAFSVASTSSPTSTSISVTWPATAGAASYDVRYGTTSGAYTTFMNVTSPYTITPISTGITYYIVVRARNTIGSGSSAQTPEVTQVAALGAPASLASSATPGNVNLTWGAVSGATSYKIFRGTTTGVYTEIDNGISSTNYSDSTAVNGTQYYYAVRAFNGADSAYSNETTIKPIETFALISATAISTSSIEVTWPAVSGASSYDIKYGTSAGSYTTTLTSQVSPKTITGLSPGTTYYVIVVAKNAVGSGTSVNSTESSLVTAFGAPAGLAASATTGGVALIWSAVSGATNYKVGRSTSSGGPYTDIATGVSNAYYTDTTASNGTIYYYAVKAFNGVDSAYSSEVTIKSISPFTFTSATPTGSTAIDLVWTGATGADSFDIRYGTTSGVYTSTASNVTSPYTLTGLAAGTTYYIVIRAKNTVGTSTNLDSSSLSAKTASAAPASLVASATSGQIALTWSAATSATSYNVYRGTATGVYTQLASNILVTNYTDSTASNGTQYYYAVRANNGTESANSNEATALPMASFSIASIAAASTTSINLSWTGPTGAATYDVRYGTVSGSYTTTLSSVTSPYTITGLTSGTTYYVVVRANNTIGSGSNVQSTQSSQVTPIGAPTGLVATNPFTGGVGLTWSTVAGATSYRVYRGTTSGVYSLLASGVSSGAYSDTTASNGTTYYYAVTSFNGAESVYSSEVSKQPISSFSLTAATAASASTINLTWGAASGATSYDVRYGTSSGVYLSTVTNVTSPYTLTGLTSGTTYYISIQAKNAVGTGATVNSNEMNAKTAVGAPSGLAAVSTPATIDLSWGAVSGATSYNIYRSATSGGPYSQVASAITLTTYRDTPVTNGTTYYYVFRAYNGIESVDSSEVSTRPIDNFSLTAATPLTASSVSLAWGAASGASTYDIRYGTVPGTYTGTLLAQTSPATVTGLAAGTRYYFAIRANNSVGAGTSNLSSELSALTATAAPSSLTATASAGQIDLSWTNPTGGSSYNIYRSTTTGGPYTSLATSVPTNNYSDSTVVSGTTYFYVVRSNNGIESVNSSEASAATVGTFSISAINVISSTSLQIVWGAAAGATAYDVYYRTSPTGTYTTVASVTSPYSLTTVANTTYYVKIRARNTVGSGSSTYSAELSQITPVAAPTGLTATGGTSSVSLNWVAASGATSYKILRGTMTGVYSQIDAGITGTTYTDSTAVNGTTYFYALKSFNGSDSATSSEVSRQPIASPSITSITTTSTTSITVSWPAASGAATYDINYGTATGTYTATVSGVTSPATITGLTSGVTYYVQLVAKNAVGGGSGTSVNSAESSGAPNSAPVMSALGDQSMVSDSSLAVPFTLSDSNNLLSCTSSMSGSSSNTTLLPNANIVFSATPSMPNCTVTITPAAGQSGTATVTITATDGITPVGQTLILTVSSCTVATIAWQTQPPANTNAGTALATAPQVRLLKADGSLCTGNTNPVTLDIGTDASIQQDAQVNSGFSVTPSAGIATFPAAIIQRAGSGHTLIASQGTISSLESSTFNINAIGASKIAFFQQPATVRPNTNISPAPVVRITDTYGNFLSAGTGTVALTLKTTTTTVGVTTCTATNAGATLTGGSATMGNGGGTGTATFSSLQVNTAGSYCLSAALTGYTNVPSVPFTVIPLTPVNTVSIIELLQGPVSATSTTSTFKRRGSILFRPTSFDGTVKTFYLKIVATNTSTSAATVKFNSASNTTQGTISVPGSTTVPSLFTVALTSVPTTAFVTRLYLAAATGGTLTVYSAQLVAVQSGATAAAIYIPLSSVPTSTYVTATTGAITSTSTTYATSVYLPAYTFNATKFSRIDSTDLYLTGINVCVGLFNKDTNTQIGTNLCTTATSEALLPGTGTARSANVTPTALNALTTDTNVELRFKKNSGSSTAVVFKAGLMLNMIGLHNMKTIQTAVPYTTALAANTNFNSNRVTSFDSNTYYGTALTDGYVRCRLGAAVSGSGALTLKDYGTSTSGTTPVSTISSSTINLSTQAQYSDATAGPLATTGDNYHFINYAHTSGSFNIQRCLYEEEITY